MWNHRIAESGLWDLRFNILVQKKQWRFFFFMISNKLALWYLNHISTMEKERVTDIVQVKPDNSQTVLCWNIYSVRAHNMDGTVLCQGKTTYPMDGWMDGWVDWWEQGWRAVRTKSGWKWRETIHVLASFPFSRYKTGRSKSPESIHHIASRVTCRWRLVQLKETAMPLHLQSSRV